MKIALAQLNYHIGNFEGNLEKMIGYVIKAKALRADLILFGELATCGYPPRDFLEFTDFIEKAYASVEALAKEAKGIAVIVGSPSRNPRIDGKDLFNSAYFLADGKVQYVQHKTLLPTYDIFDEYRYFEPGSEYKIIEFKGKRLALTICEDMWNVGNENPLYTSCPMDQLILQQPDLMINISASPFSYDHQEDRLNVLRANVARYKLPLFYCNQVGAQTDIIFDGGSVVLSPDGKTYDEAPYFEECLRIYDLDKVIAGGQVREQPKIKTPLIHDALVLGIKDYFQKMNLKTAILGLSGGIDSAVVAVLAVRALGADRVRVLLMPSEFSSEHSVSDAREMAAGLGVQYDVVPISAAFDAYQETLKSLFRATSFNIAEENLQARIRGTLLMAMSNKFGNILLNTSNKSEMSVGYGTLYGDMCGGISVIGDLYKTEVYELAHFMNKDGIVIPENIIYKAPSAELRPNQKDSDSLPEYDILDRILFQYIEKRQGPKEIIALGHDPALVARILKMVNKNEFKRAQTAPVLRVSSKAFGSGRRMPIVGKYLS